MSSRRPSPRFTEVRHCACLNLRQAARAVTQHYDQMLEPSGLRITQFSLLSVIRLLGTASISQLAEVAVMDRTTLTRNLDLLARQKLVRVQPGTDGRVREVSLTPTAESRLDEAFPLWEKAQARMSERLGAERMGRMLSDLSTAIKAAQPEPASR
jgi:DNA-binding MarR family transcriptional regulator